MFRRAAQIPKVDLLHLTHNWILRLRAEHPNSNSFHDLSFQPTYSKKLSAKIHDHKMPTANWFFSLGDRCCTKEGKQSQGND